MNQESGIGVLGVLGPRGSGCGFMVDWVLCEIEKEEE